MATYPRVTSPGRDATRRSLARSLARPRPLLSPPLLRFEALARDRRGGGGGRPVVPAFHRDANYPKTLSKETLRSRSRIYCPRLITRLPPPPLSLCQEYRSAKCCCSSLDKRRTEREREIKKSCQRMLFNFGNYRNYPFEWYYNDKMKERLLIDRDRYHHSCNTRLIKIWKNSAIFQEEVKLFQSTISSNDI